MISNKELIAKAREAIANLDPDMTDHNYHFEVARTILRTSFDEGYRTIKIVDVLGILNDLEAEIAKPKKVAENGYQAPDGLFEKPFNW